MLKYVAEGVLQDIEKLLNDFVKAKTVEFPQFANIWRKHNFSLIFLGRSEEKELIEFTHESFRIALRFLVSSSHLYQVGGLYVLYGLFRNQPSIPPIKVRIQLCHWKNIAKLRDEAEEKKFRSLHYVIDYMIENGFDFVACQTLMGPRISSHKNTSKLPPKISQLMATLKVGMTEFKETKSLEELNNTYTEYLKSKSGIAFTEKMKNHEENQYEYFMKEIDKLLSGGFSGTSRSMDGNDSTSENIGSRRAQLKAAQFAKKSAYRRGVLSDSDLEIIEDEPKKERKPLVRKKRVPKEKKRVGRPRKTPVIVESEEDSTDIDDINNNDLLVQQTEKYILNNDQKTTSKRVRRPIRKRFYYEEPSKSKVYHKGVLLPTSFVN